LAIDFDVALHDDRVGQEGRAVGAETQIVEFYERMVTVLAERGLLRESHQTPAEFASQTGFTEAVKLTGKYNDVRFGKADLTASERDAIESWLGTLSAKG
jgi:hypothetical protein